MFTWTDFWAGLVLPAALTTAVLIAGWRWTRRHRGARDSRSWAGPLAVFVGFAAGFTLLFGRPELPPLDAVDWLYYLAPLVAMAGTLDALLKLRLPARLVLTAAAVAATFFVVTWTLVSAEGEGGSEAFARTAIAAAIGIASVAALDALAARVSAARASAILLAIAAPAAMVLVLSGSLRIGQIGSILVGCATGTLLGNLVLGSGAVARGTVLTLGSLLGGLLLSGHVYAELSTSNALLLAAAPNAAWVTYLLPRRWPWLVVTLIQLAAVLGVAGVALVRAWLRFVEQSG